MIGLIARHFGWMGVLVLMVVLSGIGALALLRAACFSEQDPVKAEPTKPSQLL